MAYVPVLVDNNPNARANHNWSRQDATWGQSGHGPRYPNYFTNFHYNGSWDQREQWWEDMDNRYRGRHRSNEPYANRSEGRAEVRFRNKRAVRALDDIRDLRTIEQLQLPVRYELKRLRAFVRNNVEQKSKPEIVAALKYSQNPIGPAKRTRNGQIFRDRDQAVEDRERKRQRREENDRLFQEAIEEGLTLGEDINAI